MQPLGPIYTLDLFPEMQSQLLHLLSTLTPSEWAAPTACDGWSVKDIAAHMIADDLGVVSRGRDGHSGLDWFDASSYGSLVASINRQNDEWVRAMRRLSTELICELLWMSGEQLFEYFCALDPHAIGGAVSWAGPDPAPVWLDIAREYTEGWAHQQQIRDTVEGLRADGSAAGLRDRRFFAPVLDAYARALPHTFRDTNAPDGTHVRLVIDGDAGGSWSLVRGGGSWALWAGVEAAPAASVTMDQDVARRLFTKGMAPAAARERASLAGDAALAARVLETVAILG
jgi:uncharacterized protein (TIGR03083 family)